MTKDQLIQIAKAAFPDVVKKYIDFDSAEMHHMFGVYRLYAKDSPFILMLPEVQYLSVFIGENGFIQIESGGRAFNHYAAIKKMEELRLIQKTKQ